MYYVNLFKNNILLFTAPFKEKDAAIKYFNKQVELKDKRFFATDYIEISDGNCVIFESEV